MTISAPTHFHTNSHSMTTSLTSHYHTNPYSMATSLTSHYNTYSDSVTTSSTSAVVHPSSQAINFKGVDPVHLFAYKKPVS